MNADQLDVIARRVIGAAIAVHRELGPGLLESCYEACLSAQGFKVGRQKLVPVKYREITLDCGYRIDLLVEDAIIVEVKSVQQFAPIHDAQVISYLRLSNLSLALLINFNVRLLKQGIRRFVNNFPETAIHREERQDRHEEKTLIKSSQKQILGPFGALGGEDFRR